MPKITIYKLQLLAIPVKDGVRERKQFLLNAKDLIKNASKKGIDPDLFHNEQVAYSGIQVGRYQGAVELTAIGKPAVKTLRYWFKQFKKQNNIPLKNLIISKERYTPEFLDYQKNYRIRTLLINDDLAKELNELADNFARQQRLEKYLYGNLLRFFNYIDFRFDTKKHFLKVNVERFTYHKEAKAVYHDNKKTAIDIIFKVNFRLPQNLRLGQSTAVGYGKLIHL